MLPASLDYLGWQGLFSPLVPHRPDGNTEGGVVGRRCRKRRSPPPSTNLREGGMMELGNYLKVSKTAPAYPVVRMCIWNCLVACKEYGINPVGSFEMSYHDLEEGPWVWVRYSFVSDE